MEFNPILASGPSKAASPKGYGCSPKGYASIAARQKVNTARHGICLKENRTAISNKCLFLVDLDLILVF